MKRSRKITLLWIASMLITMLVYVSHHMAYKAANLNDTIETYRHGYRNGARDALHYVNEGMMFNDMPKLLQEVLDDYEKVRWYVNGDTMYLEGMRYGDVSARYLKIGDTLFLDSIFTNKPDSNIVMIRYK